MNSREPISTVKLVAMPEMAEQIENPITQRIRIGFRLPVRSEIRPIR